MLRKLLKRLSTRALAPVGRGSTGTEIAMRADRQSDYFKGLEAPAVVLIDMQTDFVENLLESVRRSLIPAQVDVLGQCAERDIPVIVLEFYGHGNTIKPVRKALKRVRRKKFITKYTDDGFDGTGLKAVLDSSDVKSLLLIGINAHACVLATAESGILLGYKVRTSEVLIADGNEYEIKPGAREWYVENGCLTAT